MRLLQFITLLLLLSPVFAQEQEVELQIGDTIFFDQCHGESYNYIDLYVKTRFELDSISYDSLSGWEFYNRFYNTGDFDVSRLPCSYQYRYGIIKHMMAIEDDEGEWLNVIVVMIRDGSSTAHIIEEAFEEEVIYAPKEDSDH